MVLIEYYGPSTQYTSVKEERVSLFSLKELFQHWDSVYEGFSEYVRQSCGLTINLEYVDLNESVKLDDSDEVAVIPPVSSG
jgi:molybdopterin converting factor small subunit